MKESQHEDLRKILQEALPPMDPELRCDLWPHMLRRLDASGSSLPWYDWALIGGSAGMLAFFPRLILLIAYHV